ncbi:hypothetical protein PanWU01x14_182330 [Parasponia andersonii]|uniref:Uncharacterized protein n=1 Tax=Parasponia andersonii TaxID=3476 RepID=A0A2P5C5B5_PARAD|nr:hypothetical protein PanWU01x14_182330 [Parasponia andersonii]
MTHEIPSNAEKEAFASEVNTIKTIIKDCESYIKSLNEEILIDEGRAIVAHARGLVGDSMGSSGIKSAVFQVGRSDETSCSVFRL